ncbi:MAG: hypothetical protein JO322_11520 [Candidatus Eremiobacteraeota bacterium]|nr:hypothetical protein [Candidatus Eremiobacteraeota bacterium]
MKRTVAISLKIPDNAAYTTLTTLQRLQLDVAHVERSEVWVVEDDGSPDDFIARMESNETIFNPNKHRLVDLGVDEPRPGEVWIAEHGAHNEMREHLGGKKIPGVSQPRRFVGWRLLNRDGAPVDAPVVRTAAERLLCNPAIEMALYEGK